MSRTIILTLLLVLVFSSTALAFDVQEMDEIFGAGGRDSFFDDVSGYASEIVSFIRVVGMIIVALLVVSFGLTLLFSGGDPRSLAALKIKVIFLLIGLTMVFFTESIAGLLLGIFF